MRVEFLRRQIAELTRYLLLKVDQRDWHGVADAAMDIRELEAVIKELEAQ